MKNLWEIFTKPISLLSVLVMMTECVATPRVVYDFDDGTTQGWKITAVADDKGVWHTPAFPLSHFEAAQYPNRFPGGDPPSDNKGCLYIDGGEMGPWQQQSGFPSSAKYWEVIAYYNGLNARKSNAWLGIKGVKASLGDNFGAVPGQLTANKVEKTC